MRELRQFEAFPRQYFRVGHLYPDDRALLKTRRSRSPLLSIWRIRCKLFARQAASVKVTTKKTKYGRKRRKSIFKPLKRFEVSLDGSEIKMALNLGDGDLILGIRPAIVIASMPEV